MKAQGCGQQKVGQGDTRDHCHAHGGHHQGRRYQPCPEVHTIEMVGHSGAITMKELAEKIGITTGTLSVAVDRLEKKHLLKRTPYHTDRRAFLIELTPEGEACFKEHHEFHLKMTRKIVSGLTASEQKTFADVIEKILKKTEQSRCNGSGQHTNIA